MRNLIIKGTSVKSARVYAGDTEQEQYAADQLSFYLEKFGIIQGDDLTIEIRRNETLPREGFNIKVNENNSILIEGADDRGVIYAVYGFLEHYARIKFFTPDIEDLGDGDITVDEDWSYAPLFEQRESDWLCGRNTVWAAKNGINLLHGKDIPSRMGGNRKYGLFVHTMTELIGTPPREQPCLSDPENLKKAIAGVREALKREPDANIMSVSQNDNRNYCKCEKCAAVDEEEGSHAGSLLRFVNAVADDIKEDYPDVIIDTLAYHYSQKPPKITKPRPNVCIRLCPINCCHGHTLDDATCENNRIFAEDLVGWGKICDRIYIWDYVINFDFFTVTYPNFHILRQNMRFFAENGVKGIYPEGNYKCKCPFEFYELRCYLLAKLLWNPYMSTTEYHNHMNEFLAAYYGKGWRYVKAYIDFTSSKAVQNHYGIYSNPFIIIPKEDYAAMEDSIIYWWDKAEELAGNRIENVKNSRQQWEYIRLMLHPDAEKGKLLYDTITGAKALFSESKVEVDNLDFGASPDTWHARRKIFG